MFTKDELAFIYRAVKNETSRLNRSLFVSTEEREEAAAVLRSVKSAQPATADGPDDSDQGRASKG